MCFTARMTVNTFQPWMSNELTRFLQMLKELKILHMVFAICCVTSVTRWHVTCTGGHGSRAWLKKSFVC